MTEEIEIPFGAFDSETIGWTYAIPEGFTAKIEDGKIIVEKKESADERIRKEQQPKVIQWTGKNLKEVIDFTGKSPRFGEWFKSWDDFENYVHAHNDILKLFCEDGSHYEVPVGAWIIKTPDGFNMPSLFKFVQKPAEWSEEDKGIIHEVASILINDENRADNKAEEDRLAYLAEKIQSLCPQPHWKPSEEQMRALEDAKMRMSLDGYGLCPLLQTLIDDLKKL